MRMYSLKPKPEYDALARKIAEVMPAVGGDQQRGGWYDVMERDAAAGRDDPPLRLPRPQGVVAAGAGHPGLPDPARRRSATTSTCAWPASRPPSTTPSSSTTTTARVYFNVLANGIAVPARHRAVQGQPLDERLPLGRAVLPGAGLHQPADHQAAAGPVLQAAARRVQATTSCACRPTSCRRAASASARSGSTASRTPTSTPTALTVKLPDTSEQVRVKVRVEPTGK